MRQFTLIPDTPDFLEFWAAYPRKVSKGDARRAWHQTEQIRPELSVILDSLKAAKKSDQWTRDGGNYIPYPATWLRSEGWEDVHEAAPVAQDTTAAWTEFRASIRNAKVSNPGIGKIVQQFGGLYKLGELRSFDIDRMRPDFDRLYNSMNSH